jgi:hypothetical protein
MFDHPGTGASLNNNENRTSVNTVTELISNSNDRMIPTLLRGMVNDTPGTMDVVLGPATVPLPVA